ncbi:NAD-dependent epimerase/dehydratase family protein [Flavisolibacter tropicus]|uniref:NAD-dependent epimerase/dehydratase domain-containing protein n=1 Tax=Flavisolibacter tropicus TaxID=1492898 RepID=A0A172TZN8_9BACT|nr:NAD(P)-dependent oxidoreductase [Flavisolibacter tropicus]ANE52442.1 hypothetical protein SY85_20105 [Flavisolibacter tropicus]
MKKVLIVGANGFLGRTLLLQCLSEGWTVHSLVSSLTNSNCSKADKVFSIETIQESKEDNYDYIFNVAAYIPYLIGSEKNEKLIDSNIDLVLKLHKWFPDSKIIFASSISVYGSNKCVLTENSECFHLAEYGLSKLAGELITSYHQQFSIVRFPSLYGKGMYAETFIPRVINDAKAKGEITLFGDGSRMQNYLSVYDAARYCINAALYGENEVYLGIYPKSYSNWQVAELIAIQFEPCKIKFAGADLSKSVCFDNSYTLNKLMYTPEISLEVGLKELING